MIHTYQMESHLRPFYWMSLVIRRSRFNRQFQIRVLHAHKLCRRAANRFFLVVYTKESSNIPPNARNSGACDAVPSGGRGVSLWDSLIQYVYYGYGGERELIGTIDLLDAY